MTIKRIIGMERAMELCKLGEHLDMIPNTIFSKDELVHFIEFKEFINRIERDAIIDIQKQMMSD